MPGASVHWYGKEDVRVGRKVGHVTICAPTPDEARARLAAVSPVAAAAMCKETFVPGASASSSPSTSPSPSSPGGPLASAATPAAQRGGADPEGAGPRAARVAIVMGSDSDLPTMAGAAEALAEFGVECDVTVVSAHRTPERMVEFARTAAARGVKVGRRG